MAAFGPTRSKIGKDEIRWQELLSREHLINRLHGFLLIYRMTQISAAFKTGTKRHAANSVLQTLDPLRGLYIIPLLSRTILQTHLCLVHPR